MDGIPPDAQTAFVSFVTALLVGGPFALLGAFGVVRAARIIARLILRGRIVASIAITLLVCLLGSLGLLGAAVSVQSILGWFSGFGG